MEPTKVSIIIPTYNRANIIGETINSVVNQTYENWECLVVDDGSDDNTEEVLETFMRKDERIRYIRRPEDKPNGANVCRNIGVEMSSGDYFQFLDSDDLLAPDKLEVQMGNLQNFSRGAIATCRWGGIRVQQKKAKLYNGLPTYFSTNRPIELLEVYGANLTFFPSHAFLVPKVVVLKAGKWNEDLLINQDGEFFSRVILNSSAIYFSMNTYVLYRSGAGNRITGSQKKKRLHYMKSLELIDQNIHKSKGIRDHSYVRQRKSELYYRLQKEDTQLIAQNPIFFRRRTSGTKYIFYRLVSGLKSKIFKKAEIFDFPPSEKGKF